MNRLLTSLMIISVTIALVSGCGSNSSSSSGSNAGAGSPSQQSIPSTNSNNQTDSHQCSQVQHEIIRTAINRVDANKRLTNQEHPPQNILVAWIIRSLQEAKRNLHQITDFDSLAETTFDHCCAETQYKDQSVCTVNQ